jgi:hypothetical protein
LQFFFSLLISALFFLFWISILITS